VEEARDEAEGKKGRRFQILCIEGFGLFVIDDVVFSSMVD
jgi:hypothetical protein